MAHAYTPGLKITPATVLQKERKLPLPGQVLVQKGEHVQATDVVARAELPGDVKVANVGSALSIPPEDIYRHMLKKEGDTVTKGEILASTKGIFGLFKSQAQSPTDGVIESISEVTGQLIIREAPIPVNLLAHTVGKVIEVLPDEGVVLETYASFIQGIFGIGSETIGELAVVAPSPNSRLIPSNLKEEHTGKIVVVGALVTHELVKKAVELGVKGLIAGGIDDADLRNLLGYELGVAITGTETIGITLIVTEGFGEIPIARRTFELLKQREGLQASINGATQIRAGVMRPEIIIPLDGAVQSEESVVEETTLDIGATVRIIREPHFGRLGTVTGLPIELQQLETEAHVRVLDVKLDDGDLTRLPRANVELLQG